MSAYLPNRNKLIMDSNLNADAVTYRCWSCRFWNSLSLNAASIFSLFSSFWNNHNERLKQGWINVETKFKLIFEHRKMYITRMAMIKGKPSFRSLKAYVNLRKKMFQKNKESQSKNPYAMSNLKYWKLTLASCARRNSILLWFLWKLVMSLRNLVFRSEDEGNTAFPGSTTRKKKSQGFMQGRTKI